MIITNAMFRKKDEKNFKKFLSYVTIGLEISRRARLKTRQR